MDASEVLERNPCDVRCSAGAARPRGEAPQPGDQLPNVRRRLADRGLEIPARDQQVPEALGALQKAEIKKWWPLIKAANIKGE